MEKDKIDQFNKIILDNAPVSIITIDKEGYITSANKYFQNVSWAKDNSRHNVFKGEFFNRENLVDDYKKLLTDGTPVRRDKCYDKNSKGEDVYLKILAVPFRDEEGNIEGAISMAIDNTEVILTKNKLRELNSSLEKTVEERTAELNKVNGDLAEALNMKAAFMAEVSHELRNPLAIIQLNLEMMSRAEGVSEENMTEFEQIFGEVKRMTSLLSDLTMLVNSDIAGQKLNCEQVGLRQLIAEVRASLKVIANKKEIVITQEGDLDELEITADKALLEKMLSNLVRNAIKYNKTGGWVKVRARADGDKVILEVEDGGIGIPKESLPHVFERFYRAANAKETGKSGSGLGLAICQRIAEIHGGKIEVKSEVGQGTCFTVSLLRVLPEGVCLK